MSNFTLVTHSPKQTRKLGTIMGKRAQGGDIYLLSGNLGTGKTCLIQGLAFGLGVKEYACSPSFMIAREYHGNLTLYHLDLYRLDNIEEIFDLGLDEYFREDTVCAIEWAEKGSGALPRDNLIIELEHMGEDSRRISLIPRGPRYKVIVKQLKEDLKQDKEEKWNFQ